MSTLLIDNGTTLLKKLETLIPGEKITHSFEDVPEYISNFDLVILSGGSKFQLVGNEEKFSKEIDFIKNSKISVIGICFGCELITLAFQGTLRKLEVPHKGIREIKLKDRGVLKVYEHHEWIIDLVPPNFEIIAESESGPEVIKHKYKPIYGLQFHPENFTDRTDGDEFFLRLFKELSN